MSRSFHQSHPGRINKKAKRPRPERNRKHKPYGMKKTGYPVETDLLGVTIISDNSVDGDALSTACLALGYEPSLELIESLEGIEALFITSDGEIHTTY